MADFLKLSESEIKAFKWGNQTVWNQLVHRSTRAPVKDFVIERTNSSISVMNTNGGGFTCVFSLADHIAEEEVPKVLSGYQGHFLSLDNM